MVGYMALLDLEILDHDLKENVQKFSQHLINNDMSNIGGIVWTQICQGSFGFINEDYDEV